MGCLTLPIHESSPESTREGSTIGWRVWTRTRRTWGMSASASVRLCRRESLKDSGSPPLRMISSSEGSRAISSKAAFHRGASPA